MRFFFRLKQISRLSPDGSSLSLRLVVLFTLLTLVLTAAVIVAWEQLLRPSYYDWVGTAYPGPEYQEQRYKLEQRGEHFFISISVDLIVVSILLALVNREHHRLIEAHDQLAQSEKISSLGQVAAQVAHEVRNPLAGLLLYSFHLKSKAAGTLPVSEIELIDKIIETINHLTSTTERILSFARPVNLALRQVDLNQVIGDVVQLLEPQISANGIDTRLDLSESTLTGRLDEAAIRAALLNLVLNAVQSMPAGGRLNIASGAGHRMLWLDIADTGSGIHKDQLKRIFEPFRTTRTRGLGLGMPYARKIIEQHRGAIALKSELGEGTCVRIELPAQES